MTQEQTTLSNGLRIVTAELPGAQSLTACVFVGVGSRYEDTKNNGVSHFLEHLLFKGTPKRPSTKIISEEIDAVGGWNNAYTSSELTNYYIKVPKKYSGLALDILCDMVRNPLLDPAEVDRERPVIVEEMNVYRDDPARQVANLAPPLLWPKDPLGYDILGSEKVIESIARDKIAEYKEYHYNPKNMVVSVAGRVKHDEIVAQVKQLLGGMKGPGGRPHLRPAKESSRQLANAVEKDTAQAHFTISAKAYPYLHKNDPAARVIANILGKGLSSRLFMNVRELKGLAYSVYADIHNFTDTGLFEVYAGVNVDKIEEAIEAVMHELRLIKEELVSPLELTKAKNQIRGRLEMALESNSSVAQRLGTQLVLLGETHSVEETMEKIEAVTVEDVQRVAQQMLALENLRMGIIAPKTATAVKCFEKLVKG